MTRNRWYGIYSLAHILVLALLLSACSQESAPVVDEVAQVEAVPTLTPLPPPAVAEVEPTNMPDPTATIIVEPTEVTQIAEVTEESVVAPTAIPPTQTALPEPTPVPTDDAPATVNVTTGQTDDGTFFIGDINAPVRLVDYSDFV